MLKNGQLKPKIFGVKNKLNYVYIGNSSSGFGFYSSFQVLAQYLSKIKNRKVLKNDRKVDDSDFLEIK